MLALLAPAFLLTTPTLTQAPPNERKSSLTGIIKHHRDVESKHFTYKRNLIVYLPPDYDKETRRSYPVFYMHDGQNLMDGMTSFIPNKEWRVDETAEMLIKAKLVEPFIIVGIDNGGAERGNEYLPTEFTFRNSKVGGKAELYSKMVTDEIMPMIESTYRVKKGPANTYLGGSSFGGIITLSMGLNRPDKFGKLAVVSPSVWINDREPLKWIDGLKKRPNLKVWVDIGTAEGIQAVGDTNLLTTAMIRKGWKSGWDLAFVVDKDAQHNEDAWAKRFPQMLMFLMRK